MAIARVPSPPSTIGGTAKDPTFVAGEPFPQFAAVAVAREGSFNVVRPCGATLAARALQFVGFSLNGATTGMSSTIITGRGSSITPLVEGSLPLTPNLPVFLSLTPGRVTQTPPSGTGAVVVPLGFAVNSSKMVFETDYRVLTH